MNSRGNSYIFQHGLYYIILFVNNTPSWFRRTKPKQIVFKKKMIIHKYNLVHKIEKSLKM